MFNYRIIPPVVGSITTIFAAIVLAIYKPTHLDCVLPLGLFTAITFWSLKGK